MLPTFCDKLPATKSSKHNRILFIASDRQTGGVLTLTTDRSADTYAVVESVSDWTGRAFILAKYEGEEVYSVFCTAGADPSRCDCIGHEHHGHCKHVAALERLIAEGCL